MLFQSPEVDPQMLSGALINVAEQNRTAKPTTDNHKRNTRAYMHRLTRGCG